MKDFLEILKRDIGHFNWSYNKEKDSYYGYGTIDAYEFRDEKNNHCINSTKSIFISGELYKGEDRSFRYIICSQKQLFRGYRMKKYIDKEVNKVYISGKTLDELYKKMFESGDFLKFIIEK